MKRIQTVSRREVGERERAEGRSERKFFRDSEEDGILWMRVWNGRRRGGLVDGGGAAAGGMSSGEASVVEVVERVILDGIRSLHLRPDRDGQGI